MFYVECGICTCYYIPVSTTRYPPQCVLIYVLHVIITKQTRVRTNTCLLLSRNVRFVFTSSAWSEVRHTTGTRNAPGFSEVCCANRGAWESKCILCCSRFSQPLTRYIIVAGNCDNMIMKRFQLQVLPVRYAHVPMYFGILLRFVGIFLVYCSGGGAFSWRRRRGRGEGVSRVDLDS